MFDRQSNRSQARAGTLAKALAGTLALAVVAPLPSQARSYNYGSTEINQKDAGGYASNNYWNGSGDSKDEGVRNAMRALNRLASLDIGGAFHYGYKGYGNYANSQRMDDLDAATWKKKASMNSIQNQMIGGGPSGGSGNNGGDITGTIGPEGESAHLEKGQRRPASDGPPKPRMLKDMDPGFLYRGETGEVAAEFEKRSGMKREEFFTMLSNAEATGFNWDDPNLMDKVEAQYRLFISRVPNKEYRDGIERAHALFPMAKKLKVFEEALAFYQKTRYGADGGAAAAAASEAAGADGAQASSARGAAPEEAPRAPASEAPAAITAAKQKSDEAPRLTKEQMGMYLGLEGTHGDELKDFVSAEDSLFRVVSKRYRKLTPMMIGRVL